MPTVGLILIVKDEEKTLPGLLRSVEGAFDEIVLVDTGSFDDTVPIFQAWGKEELARNPDARLVVDHFKWTGDFAEARNYAHGLSTSDWQVWADADDEIVGAQSIRGIVANAPEPVVAFICDYNYAQTEDGTCVCRLRRERIVRRGNAKWEGRVHEAQAVQGAVTMVPSHILEWRHRKQWDGDPGSSSPRNLAILEKWGEDEPENTRVLAYLGTENAMRGEHEKAVGFFERYQALVPGWDEERAQVYRKWSTSLMALNRWPEAKARAWEALDVMPAWPDSYITLAECAAHDGEWAKAIQWADAATERGMPNTLLIINPLDYSFLPLRIKAFALGNLNQPEAALEVANAALASFPDGDLIAVAQGWRATMKRERTADTYVMAAEQLINHDEQLKAFKLLTECVPYFAIDHPKVVAARVALKRRLEWLDGGITRHYNEDGPKQADLVPDDQVDPLCEVLPRAQFLLRDIKERLGVTA